MNVLGISVPEMKQQVLSPIYQVFISGTVILSQFGQFWDIIRSKLANKSPFTASIRGIKIRLPKLQDNDKEAKTLRSEGLPESWENIKQVLFF